MCKHMCELLHQEFERTERSCRLVNSYLSPRPHFNPQSLCQSNGVDYCWHPKGLLDFEVAVSWARINENDKKNASREDLHHRDGTTDR